MTTVLLADDHTLVREGLAALLSKENDMEIVGQAADGRAAVRLAKQLKPAVVVIDVAMPELNGIAATELLVKTIPGVRVVALSMHADSRYVRRMLDAGALGYVLKNSASRELATAIRAVARGRRYFSPGLEVETPRAPRGDGGAALTTREREVLQLIAEGFRTADIAERLFISVKTVETHRKRIMDKLGLDNVAALVKYAIREGIITLNE